MSFMKAKVQNGSGSIDYLVCSVLPESMVFDHMMTMAKKEYGQNSFVALETIAHVKDISVASCGDFERIIFID